MRLSAIGTTIDSGVIVFFWAAGAVILRLFVLLTQGKATIIEEQTVAVREFVAGRPHARVTDLGRMPTHL